ncbi:MAG: Eco57I restriction-modification methylase domain-containing protein, partial [Angustibacter sp.]
DVPLGVVTDGRWWGLVWAPRGGTTGVAIWDAGLFTEEPDSLRALVAWLGRARFLGVPDADTLPDLLAESLNAAEEVTETLGRQVRQAVELLILTLDQLDADSGDTLLAEVDPDELYAGAVTVMMRIVFLLFAEDRRLLPSDDDLYLASYSVATLVNQLEQRAQLAGEQALEHRTGAWHRLLATSRALHGGVAHENLRLPAYGGGLFDPARHPWLEAADRVDDRTVLRMLRAVQYVELAGERRRLSFRALDVEQIGYVYEGLLELEVRVAGELTVSLARATSGANAWPRCKEPAEVPLSAVTQWLAQVPPRLAGQLKARLGRTESAIEKLLIKALDEHESTAIARVVADPATRAAIKPLASVLHWRDGVPAITLPGRRYVAPGQRRASTGTHYTPRSMAERVAAGALEPLVYRPGPLETADRSAWRLRPSAAISELRVADIAMGSGAFLVAACRYLADRLVEAWQNDGRDDALQAERAAAGLGAGRLDADAEVEQIVLT